MQDIHSAPKLELQIKIHDMYENARQDIECSLSDTYKIHCDRIQEKIIASDHFEECVQESDVMVKLGLDIPLEPEFINNVFQLTSRWCQQIDLPLDGEIISKILIAFDYLEIDYEKEVDIFFEHKDAPLHLRIKTIHLFCINFVYLLETQGMLEEYKAFFTDREKRDVGRVFNRNFAYEEWREHNFIATLIKRAGPLAHYICLLQIEMEDRHVTSLPLGTDSAYFVYDLLYEENCKSARLKHKGDFEDSSTKMDLIVELNTINNPMTNRRLEILVPFVRNFMFKQYERHLRFTGESVLIVHCYAHFMGIFTELTEICISHFLHFSVNEIVSESLDEYFDGLLVDVIKTAKRLLPGLNALFIRGFRKFPDALVPILKKMKLKKFGAMCTNGAADFLIIYRLLNEECLLKRSITHFVGHFRALLFISRFLEKNQIKEATVANWMAAMRTDFFDDEKIVIEQIKMYFEGGSLYKPIILNDVLKIDTMYYLEISFITSANIKLHSFRPFVPHLRASLYGGIFSYESDIIKSCAIKNLKLCTKPHSHAFLESYRTAPENTFAAIETIELVISDNDYVCFESIKHYLRHFANRNTILIINLNAHRIQLENTENRQNSFKVRDFYPLVAHFVIEKKMTLKIRLRQKASANGIKESIIRNFIECFKDDFENEGLDDCSHLKFEAAHYRVDNELALNSFCL
ncbi:hypothetical protein ENBRE01_2364 [Enteropsectra breve]|nr:hypothetical protein ENBRE01_2364 [Enteropsectra breve]